jgi:hypothetical protein
MRIQGWRIDGFGVLHDDGLSDLVPGVTVLLGENEAGKSTLLAFLRAMLFGFPDGRTNQRSYPPLSGGRHGGTLLLRDRCDAEWTLRRYADTRKTIGLLRPDGSAADAAELAALLGGADARLFNSVFAFGLDELQAFTSLTGEGVGERIFDAGISGAGTSARQVMRRLEQRQEALLKQRGGRAAINDLVRELAGLDAEERDARALVRQYESLRREEREQQARVVGLQSEADARQRRSTELQALIELQPRWQEREAAARELEELPQGEQAGLADEVAGLLRELQAQQAREERLAELDATAAREGAVSNAALQHLGGGWDLARAGTLDASVVVEDEVRGWAATIAQAAEALRDAQRGDQDCAQQAAQFTAEVERRRAQAPTDEPPTVAQIDRDEGVLRGLRDDAARLETLRLKAEQQAPPRRDGARVAWVLAALAAFGAAAGLLTGHAQIGAGLAVAAALLVVVAVLTRSPGPAGAGHGDEAPVIRELQSAIAAAAAALGLPAQPSSADLAACEARLRTARTQRGEWHAAAGRIADARTEAGLAAGRADAAATVVRQAEAAYEQAAAGWAAWLSGRGLPQASPQGIGELLQQAALARDAGARAGLAGQGADQIRAQGDVCDETARRLLQAAGRDASELPREALWAALGQLHTDLARGAELRRLVESAERLARTRLSSCEHPVVALDELACGDSGIWQDEAQRLGHELERLHEERDAAIEAAAAARTELGRIEHSADIPRLQEQRESLRAQLAELSGEYRVVSAARALIAETLRSYVRERQPAVLAGGSQAFAAVTGGRYVRVEQDEAAGLASLVVVHADGRRLPPDVLSTGTQQQLYLAIRLALAAEFATRTEPLPLIMDDCLVNFDPRRAAAVAGLLAEHAAQGQCLLFTCHPQTAELMAAQTAGPVRVIEMSRTASPGI